MSPTGDRPPWQLQVRRQADGPGNGAGFYLGDGLAVTCAHVAVRAPGAIPSEPPKGSEVWVRFEFTRDHPPLPATIVGWSADADVAILRIAERVPDDAEPAPLLAVSAAATDHRVSSFGYPQDHEDEAVRAEGRITGVSRRKRITLNRQEGFDFEHGFSGAPLWDHDDGGVIGMVAWREGPRPEGVAETFMAHAMAADTIAEVWPELAERLVDPVAERQQATLAAATAQRRARLADATALPLAADGAPPRVDEVDVYDLGVWRSPYPPGDDPFVPRGKVDRDLEAAFVKTGFVIAAGPALAGKTRALIEMLRNTSGSALLIVPEPHSRALPTIESALPDATDVVVWLDDLDDGGNTYGLTFNLLHRLLRERGWRIAATTQHAWDGDRAEPRRSREVERFQRMLGRWAKPVDVPSTPSPEELAAAAVSYPGEEFDDRGLGVQLAVADDLERRFRAGLRDRFAGWAVVQAAVDWRRMGLTRPISRHQLRILSAPMLAEIGRPASAFDEGVDWATAPLRGRAALLAADPGPGGTGFRAFSRLATVTDDPDSDVARPIPQAAWTLVTGDELAAGAEDLLAVSISAFAANLPDVAVAAAERARRVATSDRMRAWASLSLVWLHGPTGDVEQIHRMLLDVVEADVPEVGCWAHLELGVLAIRQNRLEEAESELRAAMAADDTSVAALAKANLGFVLTRLDRSAEGEELLESVLAAQDDGEAVSVASRWLARLYSPSNPASSFNKVGELPNWLRGKLRGVDDLTDALHEVGGPRAKSLAALNLGGLEISRGRDPDRARRLLESALRSDDFVIVASAHLALGQLLVVLGHRADARSHFRAVQDGGEARQAIEAAVHLAQLSYAEGDKSTAIAVLQEVRDGGDSDYAPAAADVLGDILQQEGDRAGSAAAYRWVIADGHPIWAQTATVDLALLRCRGGEPERSTGIAQLREVVATGDREHAPRAAVLLGGVLAEDGDLDGATSAYRHAIDSGHAYWTPTARTDLAVALLDVDPTEAEALLNTATTTGFAVVGARAHLLLGALLEARDADEQVEQHLHEVVTLHTAPAAVLPAALILMLRSVQREELERAGEYARTAGWALEAWSAGTCPYPAGTDTTEPVFAYLAVVDQLYEADRWYESGTMLEALAEHPSMLLSPEASAAVTARQGRALLSHDRGMDVEPILRDALRQSLALGPPAAASEAMARYFLASLLARDERPDEAVAMVQPLVDRENPDYLGRATFLRGQIAARVAMASDRPEHARQMLSPAREQLTKAARIARANEDDRLLGEIQTTLDLLQAWAAPVKAPPPALEPAVVDEPSPVELPPDLLCLLGVVAGADGDLDEAEYWFARAERDDPVVAQQVRWSRAALRTDEQPPPPFD